MKKLFGVYLLMGLLSAGVAQAQQADTTKTSQATQTKPGESKPIEPKQGQPPTGKAVPATTDPNYVIGAEDVIDISVWNEPQISRSVPVRPDGKISLPLLNDVQAAGLTPVKLGAEISDGLKKFMTEPQVTVIVTGINSRRYYVTGEIQRAGTYPLLPDMTALQALASSGGFTVFANRSKIYILRTAGGKQQRIPFDYDKVLKGKIQDVTLQPGDTIVVP